MKKFLFIIILLLSSCGSDEYKTYELRPWKDGMVYYKFADEVSTHNREKIEYVFNEIEDKTKCIYFIKSDNKNAITIMYSLDYNSFATIGSDNPENILRISEDITLKTVFHEVFHNLGMIHEHQRPDRDEYISINYENILEYYASSNYDIREHLYETDEFGYEYNSIMHYGEKDFSNNGLKTIIFLNCDYEYNKRPTQLDWDKLISIYQPVPISIRN